MINHISIAVNEPERVANFLAELWDGIVYPFPPAPDSFFVLANDGRGTAVEISPAGTVLVPGEGLPDENDLDAETSEFEAKFVQSELVPRYVATHLNINSNKSIEEVRSIANGEGWRVLVCNRGGGLFQLIEVWIENTFMLEVMTPEQTEHRDHPSGIYGGRFRRCSEEQHSRSFNTDDPFGIEPYRLVVFPYVGSNASA